jgi:integrase
MEHSVFGNQDLTWDQAVEAFWQYKNSAPIAEKSRYKIKWAIEVYGKFFSGHPIRSIGKAQVTRARDIVKSRSTMKSSSVNDATKKLMQIFSFALEREWIDRIPKVDPLPEEAPSRPVLRPDQAKQLIEELPPSLGRAIEFAIATGLRGINICRLKWANVDFDSRCIRIEASSMKARKELTIPLSASAMRILLFVRNTTPHPEFVFVNERGEPYKRMYSDTWRRAVKAAGLDGYGVHSARRGWATEVGKRSDLKTLMTLGGWATPSMAAQYVQPDIDHLRVKASIVDEVFFDGKGQQGRIDLSVR